MGSLQLECPLCCTETFSSHDSLKYHLLSIIDNLLCPACGQRFEKIYDLADHLGKQCISEDGATKSVSLKNENIDLGDSMDSTIMEKSILAKALMQKPEHIETETVTIIQQEDGDEDGEAGENVAQVEIVFENENDSESTKKSGSEEDVFYCSSCMVSFTSINTHLEEYHEGQTVFIEDGQPEGQEGETQEDKSFYIIEGKNSEEMEMEDSNDSVELQAEGDYNTIQQEDCIDKDGRLYTRKVVQIEKFWDSKQGSKKAPVILQYVLENGKAKKADEFDLENLSDNQKLLIIYQCPDCSIHFSKLEQYEKHSCAKSPNSKVFKCSKCNANFTNMKSVNAHMKLHRPEKGPQVDNLGPHVCQTCNTEFPSYKSLRLHRRMHDPIKEKEIEPPVTYGIMGEDILPKEEGREMFVCEICNNSYDKQYEEVHMRSHVDEEKFDCRICNRKFYSQVNLDMHMRVHSNGKKFSCSHCKKNFLTYETLQDHITNQCSSHAKMYECQYCGRRFVRPHEKVKHERIHTGEKPHVCSICGKAFRVSYCLTLHMRTHSGTRPYQCTTCGKRFKAHSVYNHHLLTHSNERNYKCPYCPKSFKTGVQLAGHKNSHIKPFTCTECNRPFASLYAVRAHMDSHYRENNLKYNCAECGASYARAFALRDHIKAHHPNVVVDKVDSYTLPDYEMVTEGMNASNSILPDESVLVQYEQSTVQNVELVEEVTTDCC